MDIRRSTAEAIFERGDGLETDFEAAGQVGGSADAVAEQIKEAFEAKLMPQSFFEVGLELLELGVTFFYEGEGQGSDIVSGKIRADLPFANRASNFAEFLFFVLRVGLGLRIPFRMNFLQTRGAQLGIEGGQVNPSDSRPGLQGINERSLEMP